MLSLEQTLAENANALEEARERMRRKFEDVESKTGEEDEENVVQVSQQIDTVI